MRMIDVEINISGGGVNQALWKTMGKGAAIHESYWTDYKCAFTLLASAMASSSR